MAINHACHMILNNCATVIFQGERVQKQTNSCDCGLFAPASVKKIFVMALTQQPSDMTKNYM